MNVQDWLKRFTLFQITITGLVLLCLVLQTGIIVYLLQARSTSQPVLSRSDELLELADQAPYVSESMARALLAQAATELADLAESHIRYTVRLSRTVRIATEVEVNETIPVPISLIVSDTIRVNTTLPFQEQVVVPVRLEIDQVFPVSTTIPFQEQIDVPIDDVVHIDERFSVRVLGQDIQLPVRGDIPVRLDVQVPLDEEFAFRADVPVQFPISDTLPFDLDWLVPVDLDIPVNLPVETEVMVPLKRTIPIDLDLPIVLDVPLDIAIEETSIGQYLLNLSERLDQFSEN